MSKGPEQLFEENTEMWNEWNYERIPELFAEDYVMHDPPAPEEGIPGPRGEVHGTKGVELYMRMIEKAFPDWEFTVGGTLVGEREVMYEGRITMTHEGPWKDLDPTGRTVEFPLMGRLLVDEGKIQAERIYFDNLPVAAQLGMLG